MIEKVREALDSEVLSLPAFTCEQRSQHETGAACSPRRLVSTAVHAEGMK